MKCFLAVSLGLFLLTNAQAALKFGSYNIRNFDYDQRSRVSTNKDKLSQTLKEIKADFLAVQEINQTQVFKNFIDREFSGKYAVALSQCGGAHGQRLGFVYDHSKFALLKFDEDLRVSNPFSEEQGGCYEGSRPLAIGKFKIIGTQKTFIAISVHLKSGGQDRSIKKRFKQLSIINKVIDEHRAQGIESFVVMGDFNSTEYTYRGQVHGDFVKTVARMGLDDLSSNLRCTAYWWGGRRDGKQYPSQLDHILMTGLGNVKETRTYGHCAKLACAISPEEEMGASFDEVSDHCPVASVID